MADTDYAFCRLRLEEISMSNRQSIRAQCIMLAFATLCFFAPARVFAQNPADDAYNAFTSAFLVRNGNQAYIAQAISGPKHAKPEYFWVQALSIMLVMDVYDRTRDPALVPLIRDLINTAILENGRNTDWSWDIWNDDIGSVAALLARAYLITGDASFRDIAIKNWKMAYSRPGGWDNVLGGGFYETIDQPNPGDEDYIDRKSALANDYMAMAAAYLYEGTGDTYWLQQSETIYAWVRNNLFVSTPAQAVNGLRLGQVSENLWARDKDWRGRPHKIGELDPSNNVYNSGQFLVVAMQLLRLTRNGRYADDAVLAANNVVNNSAILSHPSNDQPNQWAYFFTKGLSELCNYTDRWPTYYNWMLNNAKTAWANRDPGTGLTNNAWSKPTTISNRDETPPLPHTSAVAIWQHLAIPAKFMIINRASGKALDLIGDNFANGAVINQLTANANSADQHWMILPTEEGNHFKIVATRTGKAANITGNSLDDGAQLIDWFYVMGNTGQQFDLINAGDGFFKIKNVKSGKVLEVNAASGADGAKVQQWTDNAGAHQQWRLQPVGDYYIRASHSDRYINVQGGGNANGSRLNQYDWQTNPWFKWRFTNRLNGFYQVSPLNALTKAVSIAGPTTAAGAYIQLWDYVGSNRGEQEVRIVPKKMEPTNSSGGSVGSDGLLRMAIFAIMLP
jgi:Ricin-type beta-trefoil lectin domain-like/Glycosyl hydrolase family 76